MERLCKFTSILPVEKDAGWKSPSQRETFINLFRIPFIADNFWLAGGTCLSAMYLGHRRSEDLDLFTTRSEIHPDPKQKITDILRANFEFDMPIAIHPTFASISINDVKVEFVSDMFAYKIDRPQVILDDVVCKVDSWDNLCVSKFSAFLSRTSDKDISDIGAILQTAKDGVKFKEMANFLICETRKRDSMADELTKVLSITTYASQLTAGTAYKDVFSKFGKIIIEFEKELGEEVGLTIGHLYQ